MNRHIASFVIAALSLLFGVHVAQAQITISSMKPQVEAGSVLMSCETDMVDLATRGDYISVQADCDFHQVFQGTDSPQSQNQLNNPVAKASYSFIPIVPGATYHTTGNHYLWLFELSGGQSLCDGGTTPDIFLKDPLGYSLAPFQSGGNSFTIPQQPPPPPYSYWCLPPNSPTPNGDNWIALGATNSIQVPAMQINPHNPSPISAGGTITFTTNESNVTWTLNPQIGSIPGGVYTAPSVVTTNQQVTVTAQNASNPNDKDSVTVSLIPLTISVEPPTLTLNQGQSFTFTAAIEGNNNLNATWTVSGPGNVNPATASPSTVYTAPAPIPSSPAIITAASAADSTQKATATVSLLTATTNVSAPGSLIGVTPNTPIALTATLGSIAGPPAPQPVCAWSVGTQNLGTFNQAADCSSAQFTVTSSITTPTQVTFTACNNSPKPPACGSAVTTLVPGTIITGINGTWAAGQNNNNITINGSGFGTNPTVHLSDSTITGRVTSNTNTSIQMSVDIPLSYQLETIFVTVTDNISGVGAITSVPFSVTTTPAKLAISLVQSSAQLTEGQQFQFVPKIICTLSNGTACGVPQTADWSISAGSGVGTISSSGLYQVTATGLATSTAVAGSACAAANPQACTNFSVTVLPTNISVSPAVAAVTAGASKPFSATVQNAPYSGGVQNASVNWLLDPSGSASGSITAAGLYTAPAALPANPVTVKACSQVDSSRCGTALVSFSTVPDFIITVTPDSQTVSAGSSTPARYQLTVTPINGFVGNVALSTTGLPPGTSNPFFSPPISFDGSNNTVPQTSTLTFTEAASTVTGSYHFIITGSGGGQSHTVTQSNGLPLIVIVVQPDFTLSVNPLAQTAPAGNSANYNVTITPIGGFTGTVTLTLPGTLPPGVSGTFNPKTITGPGSSLLTVATSPTTPSGTYTLTINAASGALSKNQNITLGVPCPTCAGITGITPGTGVVNTNVAITGFSFGSTQGSSSLIFNNNVAGVVQTWTDTLILASVPVGATTGPVVVRVNGQSSNGWPFTVTCATNCAPTINGITPNTGAVQSTVTISGLGFGATQGTSQLNFSQTANGVFLTNVPATASSWSDTSITATVPKGATSGGVTVSTSVGTSNSVFFNVTVPPCSPNCSPTIVNVLSDHGGISDLTPGVSHIFIAGHDFGATRGQSTVTFNGITAQPTSWSDTEIDTVIPLGATSGYIVVRVGGRSSNPVSFGTQGFPTCTAHCNPPQGQVSLDIGYYTFDQYVPAGSTFDYRTLNPGTTANFPGGTDLVPYGINNLTNTAMDITPADLTSQSCPGHFTTTYTRFNSDGTPAYIRTGPGARAGDFDFEVIQDSRKCTAVLTYQYRSVTFDSANHEVDGPVQTYAVTLSSGPANIPPDSSVSIAITDPQNNLVAVGVRNPDGTEIPGSGVADLGSLAPGSLVKVPIIVYNTSPVQSIFLDSISIQAAQGHGLFSIVTTPTQIAPGQRGAILVQLNDSTGATVAGTYTAKIYGHYYGQFNGPGTGNLFFLPMTVNIQDGPRATVFARGANLEIPDGSTFRMPAVVAGRARAQVFDIVNTGNQTLTISNLSVQGDGFSITVPLNNTTIPPHQTVADVGGPNTGAFRVRSLHSGPGTYTGTVTFTRTTPDGTATTYTFTLSSLVRPRPASASVVSAEQGSLILANGDNFDPTQRTLFAVINDGDSPLSLSNLALPPGYSVVSPLPASVDASDVAWFEVAYTISNGGALSFGTTDPATPLFQLLAASQTQGLTAAPDFASETDGLPVIINVLANDSDPSGKSLVVTNPAVVAPIYGTVTLLPDSTIRYTPQFPMDGDDSFVYEVSNGATSARATVSVKLVVAHHPPIATDDQAFTTPGTPIVINVLANDYSPDTGAVTLTYNTIVTPPQHGTAQHAATDWNSILYTPTPGYIGGDFFTYQITDTHGGYATASVGIDIEPPNSPPVAVPDSATTFINQAVNIPVTANDSDPDGDPIRVLAITTPPSFGTAVILDAGTVRYTPNAYTAGTDTFVYQIYDGHRHTASALVTVSVLDRPPVAVPDFATTNSSTAININVVANDTDPEQDPISLSNTPVLTQPASGAVVTYVDSYTLNYKPKFGFVGTDTFTYQIQDLRGSKASGTVTVTVVNRPPVAINDTASTPFNTPVTINVLQNDSDPDGHAISLSSPPVVSGPAAGASVTVSGNSLVYTPPPGFVGTDTFTYEMQDSFGAKARATVSVSIINRPPVAVPDTFTVVGSNPTQLAPLANDYDPDGEPITLVNNFVNPLHGTLAIDSYKYVFYTAVGCYVGTDTFKYWVQDSRGATTQGTVTVNVVSDHLPVAVPDNITTPSGTFTTINVTANDCHPDNQRPYLDVNYPLYVPPSHGYIQLADNTTFYYTSYTGYHGTDTFQYNLRDAAGHYTVGTVSITIP
jgi:hypothetical protein